VRIRLEEHVGLEVPGAALEGGTVERRAPRHGVAEAAGGKLDGMQRAEHIDEDEAHPRDAGEIGLLAPGAHRNTTVRVTIAATTARNPIAILATKSHSRRAD